MIQSAKNNATNRSQSSNLNSSPLDSGRSQAKNTLASSSSFDAVVSNTQNRLPDCLQASGMLHVLWASIVQDPTAGVTIVDAKGTVEFVNTQAARLYFDEAVLPEELIGQGLGDIFPAAWLEDRYRLLKDIAEDGRPRIFRTIWQGFQHLAWTYPLPEEETGQVDHYMIVTRRVAGYVDRTSMEETGILYRNADFNDLGDLDVLSTRELEVLALIGQGMSFKQIASTLHRSVKTIENHRNSIGHKLQVGDRAQLMSIARRAGLLPEDAGRGRLKWSPVEVLQRLPSQARQASHTSHKNHAGHE